VGLRDRDSFPTRRSSDLNWCGAALGIFVLGWFGLLGGGCSSLGLAGGNGRDHLGTILLILWFRFYRRFRLGWFLRFCRRFRFLRSEEHTSELQSRFDLVC